MGARLTGVSTLIYDPSVLCVPLDTCGPWQPPAGVVTMSNQPGSLRPCRQCYGDGRCFHCSGGGSDLNKAESWDGDCRSCQGTGRCVLCRGRGEVAYAADELAFPSSPAPLVR